MGSFRRRDSAVAVNLSEFSYLVVGRWSKHLVGSSLPTL
jgi:hypothetical protein